MEEALANARKATESSLAERDADAKLSVPNISVHVIALQYMPRILHVSGAELIKRLEKLGYVSVRTIGGHVRLRHSHAPVRLARHLR